MPTLQEVEKYARSLSCSVEINFELEDDELRMPMRNSCGDEPDQETWTASRSLAVELKKQFTDSITITREELDEWVDVVVKLK